MKMLPDFKNDEEEMVFWETHDPEEYLLEPREELILNFRPEPKPQDLSPSEN
jgi:hypothetical protein